MKSLVHFLRHIFLKDLNDPEQLCEIAQTAGMEKALIERLLATENDLSHIAERDKYARKMGVSAVLTFIVAGKHVVQGGQSEDFWSNVITEISCNLYKAGSTSGYRRQKYRIAN